jgi:hypothetical protein
MYDPTTESRALESMFLGRLDRCLGLSERIDVRAVPLLRRLVWHAAFSAYRDCVALGLEHEARAAIRWANRSQAGIR